MAIVISIVHTHIHTYIDRVSPLKIQLPTSTYVFPKLGARYALKFCK